MRWIPVSLMIAAICTAGALEPAIGPQDQQPQAQARPGSPTTDPDTAEQQPPASQPTSRPGVRRPAALDVYEGLLRGSDTRRMVDPVVPGRPAQPSRATDLAPYLDTDLLQNQSGRLILGGEEAEFEFVSPVGDGVRRRFEVLPNAWREAMEREAHRGITRFEIDAEVTRYHNRNFLLVRSVRRVVDHGNLGP